MKEVIIILSCLGASFILIGGVVGGIFYVMMPGIGPFLMIPMLFVILGLCFLVGVVVYVYKKKEIIRKGKKYSAKVFGYVKNTGVTVNGQYPVNIKVRYFDEYRGVKEAIIPTGFAAGSAQYPIGMTLDIYELDGKYNWDPKSVRNERLYGEEQLMDNKPLEPEKLKIRAISCNSCGSTFEAAEGYTERCPYCGNFTNAESE